jgi:hypothetical protein
MIHTLHVPYMYSKFLTKLTIMMWPLGRLQRLGLASSIADKNPQAFVTAASLDAVAKRTPQLVLAGDGRALAGHLSRSWEAVQCHAG